MGVPAAQRVTPPIQGCATSFNLIDGRVGHGRVGARVSYRLARAVLRAWRRELHIASLRHVIEEYYSDHFQLGELSTNARSQYTGAG